MHLDTELAQHHCARCKSKLTVPAVFRDGEWYHRTCWERGAHQLADANKRADAIKYMHDLYPPIVFLTERESLSEAIRKPFRTVAARSCSLLAVMKRRATAWRDSIQHKM
jgi:hypothetical protein